MRSTSPHILDDLSQKALGLAVEANLREWALLRGQLPDVELHEEDDATWLLCRSPGGPNEVYLPRFTSESSDERLEAILREYRKNRLAPQIHVGPGCRPEDLAARLKGRGLVCLRHMPGMACDLSKLSGRAGPDGMTIAPIEGFGVFDGLDHPVIGRISTPARRRALQENIEARQRAPELVWPFVSMLDDRPVGTLIMFFGAGVVGIYDVGVHPEFRRRGIATAVSAEACRFAQQRGYRAAVLTATSAGEPVYRNLGFARVCQISVYYYSKTRQRKDREQPV